VRNPNHKSYSFRFNPTPSTVRRPIHSPLKDTSSFKIRKLSSFRSSFDIKEALYGLDFHIHTFHPRLCLSQFFGHVPNTCVIHLPSAGGSSQSAGFVSVFLWGKLSHALCFLLLTKYVKVPCFECPFSDLPFSPFLWSQTYYTVSRKSLIPTWTI